MHACRFNECEDVCAAGLMHWSWLILALFKATIRPRVSSQFNTLRHGRFSSQGGIMMFTPYGSSKPSIHTSKWLFKLLFNVGNFWARVASWITSLNSIRRMYLLLISKFHWKLFLGLHSAEPTLANIHELKLNF